MSGSIGQIAAGATPTAGFASILLRHTDARPSGDAHATPIRTHGHMGSTKENNRRRYAVSTSSEDACERCDAQRIPRAADDRGPPAQW
jgi:hypothetical protein